MHKCTVSGTRSDKLEYLLLLQSQAVAEGRCSCKSLLAFMAVYGIACT
jgi:hypothetical protein